MSLKQHFELLAACNQWMNTKVYKAASNLVGTALAEDRGAFFGSLLGTLNHIVVGDTIWLKRFATHPGSSNSLCQVAELPNPVSLDQVVFDGFCSLHEHQKWLDDQIIHWISGLSAGDLDFFELSQHQKGASN